VNCFIKKVLPGFPVDFTWVIRGMALQAPHRPRT
jgi:hypothetical protein